MKKSLVLGFAIAACMLAGAALASPPPAQAQPYTIAKQDMAATAVVAVAVGDVTAAPAAITGRSVLATTAGEFAHVGGTGLNVLAVPGFPPRVDRMRVSWT